MKYAFTINGRRIVGTTREVEAALRGVVPDKVRVQSVEINGQVYPVVQAFAVAFGVDRADCITKVARRVFQRLGFAVFPAAPEHKPPGLLRPRAEQPLPGENVHRFLRRVLPHRSVGIGPAEDEFLDPEPIRLPWSHWERWEDIREYGPLVIDLPFGKSGVYEARLEDEDERLTIGRATDLKDRVMLGLVRGTAKHTSGQKIRENENVYRVVVRWAVTDRPAAAEEALHRRHLARFARLPKYTLKT